MLGFLLFLIFINDLPEGCSQNDQSVIMLLADDTKTYQRIDMEEGAQKEDQKEMQERIDRIAKWASDWRMMINPGKSKVIHLGKNNPGLSYNVNRTEIEAVSVLDIR